MKPRTFARRPTSIGSNQLSKSRPSASPARADVILLIMAWSPPALQRRNQGCEPRRLRHPIPTTSATAPRDEAGECLVLQADVADESQCNAVVTQTMRAW